MLIYLLILARSVCGAAVHASRPRFAETKIVSPMLKIEPCDRVFPMTGLDQTMAMIFSSA